MSKPTPTVEEVARVLSPNLCWEKEYAPHSKRWHAQNRAMYAATRLLNKYDIKEK